MATFALSAVRSFHNNIRRRTFAVGTVQDFHSNKSTFTQEPAQTSNAPKGDLELSDSCVKRLQEIATDGSFLRVIVEGGGCSGFQYKFEVDNKANEDDRVFVREGAKVVIDETSLGYVKGSVIDYQTELIRSAFRIVNNPMSDQGCSCGASFSVKL